MDFNIELLTANVVNVISAWGLKVLGAIVLLVVGRMFAGWTRRLVRQALKRANVDETLIPFIAGVTYYFIVAAVLVAVLGLVGIQTASLLAVFGAAGLAVGLALQGTLSNVAAGVMLLVFRPFEVGNYIEAGGTAGAVEAIGLFVTTLNTPDNVKILVPNSSVYGQTIKNYAANDTRRNDMVVGVSYDDNLATAVDTIRRVLAADSRVLADPEPVVAVAELADSSVNIVVRPWCKKEDYWNLRFDMMRQMKEQLEADGCTIPFPQRDVHLFQAAS